MNSAPYKMVSKLTAVIVMGSLWLAGCGSDNAPQAVVEPVVKPAMIEVVSARADNERIFNGVVQAEKRADLSFRVGGRLTEILVDEGSQVKKGDLLAQLDDRDAKTSLASAQIELKKARDDYQRAKSIYDSSKAISKRDLDASENAFKLAKNRADEAQRQLEYTQVCAPFDGVIGRQWVDNYVQVQANAPVLTLHDLSNLEVIIQVPHSVMLSGMKQTEANAEFSAIPGKRFPLELRTYATEADPTSQTYAVALGFESLGNDQRVLPGMAVRVSTVDGVAQTNKAISIPLAAVVPDNQGGQFVWVVDMEDRVQKRPVKVGELKGDRVVIAEALNDGDRVVVAGVSAMREGMKVRPFAANNDEA